MKRIILVLMCIVSFVFANAQIRFGLKGGATLSTFTGPDVDTAKIKFGYNIGVFGEFDINDAFSIRPEVAYSTQGGKGTKNGIDATSENNYLIIPILVKWLSPGGGFFLETGPQVGFLMSGKVKALSYSFDAKDFYKANDFSWAFGLGYNITDRFGVNGRYNFGLINVSKIDGQKARSHVGQIGLFYSFGLPSMASK